MDRHCAGQRDLACSGNVVNHIGGAQRRTARDAATRPQDVVGAVDTSVIFRDQTVCSQFKGTLVDDQTTCYWRHGKFSGHFIVVAVPYMSVTRNRSRIHTDHGLILHFRGQSCHTVGKAVEHKGILHKTIHAMTVTVIHDGIADALHRNCPRF